MKKKKKTRLSGTRPGKFPKKAIAAKSVKTVQKHRKRAQSVGAEPAIMSVPVAPVASKPRGELSTPFSFWARAPLAMMQLWLAPFTRAKAVGSEGERS